MSYSRTETVMETDQSSSTEIRLKIRLPNGSTTEGTFNQNDTLETIIKVVKSKHGIANPVLSRAHPRHDFTEDQLKKKLVDLGIKTNEVLVVKPDNGKTQDETDARAESLLAPAADNKTGSSAQSGYKVDVVGQETEKHVKDVVAMGAEIETEGDTSAREELAGAEINVKGITKGSADKVVATGLKITKKKGDTMSEHNAGVSGGNVSRGINIGKQEGGTVNYHDNRGSRQVKNQGTIGNLSTGDNHSGHMAADTGTTSQSKNDLRKFSPDQLVNLLKERHCLDTTLEQFKDNKVDGSLFLDLDDEMLNELGITKLIERRKLMKIRDEFK